MSAASFINNNVFGGHIDSAPGINPQAPNSVAFVDNPDGTRTYANGQTFRMGPNGQWQTALANPNVAQQVGADASRAAGIYNQVPGYDAREQTAFGQEQGLAADLNNTAHGIGPTVAGTQLMSGLEQGQQQQLAQAAGAGGGNAALARMTAANNTAKLAADTNQQQALARAAEAANAQRTLAGVTGSMVDQSQAESGQKLNAANTLNNLAMTGETNREGLDEKASEAQAKGNTDAMNSAFKAGGQLLTYLGL